MKYQHFKFFYFFMNTMFFIFLWLTVVLYLKYSYEYFFEVHKFQKYIDTRLLQQENAQAFKLLWDWADTLLVFIGKVVALIVVGFLFRKVPLYSMVNDWFINKEISPNMARHLARHFRFNRNINLETLFYYDKISKIESGMIHHHYSRGKIIELLESSDNHIKSDYLSNKKE